MEKIKVRVKDGQRGWIYGRFMVGRQDDSGRPGDVFYLKPIEHSTKLDEDGEPLIITPEQQFSERWMERIEPQKQAQPNLQDDSEESENETYDPDTILPSEMGKVELREALEKAGIEVPKGTNIAEMRKMLESYLDDNGKTSTS